MKVDFTLLELQALQDSVKGWRDHSGDPGDRAIRKLEIKLDQIVQVARGLDTLAKMQTPEAPHETA